MLYFILVLLCIAAGFFIYLTVVGVISYIKETQNPSNSSSGSAKRSVRNDQALDMKALNAQMRRIADQQRIDDQYSFLQESFDEDYTTLLNAQNANYIAMRNAQIAQDMALELHNMAIEAHNIATEMHNDMNDHFFHSDYNQPDFGTAIDPGFGSFF